MQFILGEDEDDGTHESHPLFSEMEELVQDGGEMEWKETARYVYHYFRIVHYVFSRKFCLK